MSSYFTFAITLTVAYIIYYAVNIVRDLYGKKGDGKTEEETFDLGPVDTCLLYTSPSPRDTATRKWKKPPRRGSSG